MGGYTQNINTHPWNYKKWSLIVLGGTWVSDVLFNDGIVRCPCFGGCKWLGKSLVWLSLQLLWIVTEAAKNSYNWFVGVKLSVDCDQRLNTNIQRVMNDTFFDVGWCFIMYMLIYFLLCLYIYILCKYIYTCLHAVYIALYTYISTCLQYLQEYMPVFIYSILYRYIYIDRFIYIYLYWYIYIYIYINI